MKLMQHVLAVCLSSYGTFVIGTSPRFSDCWPSAMKRQDLLSAEKFQAMLEDGSVEWPTE